MNNDDALKFYREMASNHPERLSTKMFKFNDNSDIDALFLTRYLNNQTELLDVGSSSGLVIEKIYQIPKSITCIEPIREFSRFIINDSRINIISSTIQDFDSDKKYDVISLMGIMQYFSAQEAADLYGRFYNWLTPFGVMIVKNQFGLEHDVVVEDFSEELGKDYFSSYRLLTHEMQMIWAAGFSRINVHDIYPPANNRWTDTHYFAIVGEKSSNEH